MRSSSVASVTRNGWRTLRRVRRRLTDVPYAVVLGLLAVNSALNLYIHPDRQPAHLLLAPWDYLWSGLYGIGGAMIVIGIGMARHNVEASGTVAFAGGAVVSALVNAITLGWSGWNTVALLTLFAVASLIRTYHLARGRVLLLVDLGVPEVQLDK